MEAATGDFYGGHRPGDNLFSQTLVCRDVKTGQRVWHFQTIHDGIWDYDLPAAPVLLDISVDGDRIPAVAQVTKQGFTFVFDRRTGKPVWPIIERPVPQSSVPGEQTAANQPFPTLPKPFERQGIGPHDLIDFTEEILTEAKRIASQYQMGPLYTPPSLLSAANKGTLMLPSPAGGANWPGAVADPETGILYIPSTTIAFSAGLRDEPERSEMRYIHASETFVEGPYGLPLVKPPWGRITAIDLNTGQHQWMIPNGDTPDKVRSHEKLRGVVLPKTGHDERVGLLVTKSLLFAGGGAGLNMASQGSPMFRAHDKLTGEMIAELKLPANQSGIPMTYAINGKQFIVVAVGGINHPGELVALTVPDGKDE
jgi:quinoprotein glucose dehydrogenase